MFRIILSHHSINILFCPLITVPACSHIIIRSFVLPFGATSLHRFYCKNTFIFSDHKLLISYSYLLSSPVNLVWNLTLGIQGMLLVERGLTEKKKRWMVLDWLSFAFTLFPWNGVWIRPGNTKCKDLIHQDRKFPISQLTTDFHWRLLLHS